eukprot:scaffold9273_cov128-Isochrysis_galbana.AAC.3
MDPSSPPRRRTCGTSARVPRPARRSNMRRAGAAAGAAAAGLVAVSELRAIADAPAAPKPGGTETAVAERNGCSARDATVMLVETEQATEMAQARNAARASALPRRSASSLA